MNPYIIAAAAVIIALTGCAAATLLATALWYAGRNLRRLRTQRRDLQRRLATYRQWADAHLDQVIGGDPR